MSATETMQIVDCKFPGSEKRYCYHFELNGEAPLQAGDRVDVMTDTGEITVEVVGVRDEPPRFKTRGIIRVVSRAA